MSAVTMHHFSGLAAPFVRSKGTVSGGVFIRSQTEFEWYININGNAEKYIAENCPKIHNEPYRDRAEKTKKLRDSSYYNIFRLHIGFDEVRAFKKRFGKFIRQSQWKDTDVVVYMR